MVGRRFNQSGLRVATTNHAAKSTVTACEKINQYRRMMGGNKAVVMQTAV